MNIGVWLLLSAIFWIMGYLQSRFLEPVQESKLVYVPMWLFVFFGAPKQKKVPVKVLQARGVFLQLVGSIMALYGILNNQNLGIDPDLSGLYGIAVSMLLGGVTALWLYRRRPFVWIDDKRDNDK